MRLLWFLLLLDIFRSVTGSTGDKSPIHQQCMRHCTWLNCTTDLQGFSNDYSQPFYLALLKWSCEDECRYNCMWKTVDAFHEFTKKTPQFHGKWPFMRFLGIQEPASVLFSLLNFYTHWIMLKRFRIYVQSDAPFFWMWHIFGLVSLNAWIWSTVFHSRDFPLTELMDYVCAFSIVITSCLCMILRLMKDLPKFVLITISTYFMAFFANHAVHLGSGKIDYGYNMLINIVIGTFTALCWFIWCFYNRLRQPYVWKCGLFVTLASLCTVLEVIDQPPILWIFDSHSLWHLSTVPLTCLFYNFIIDDCVYLNEMKKKMIGKTA